MSKHKLSKTVLEMKFMKKTKIQQEKVIEIKMIPLTGSINEFNYRTMLKQKILTFWRIRRLKAESIATTWLRETGSSLKVWSVRDSATECLINQQPKLQLQQLTKMMTTKIKINHQQNEPSTYDSNNHDKCNYKQQVNVRK